MRQPWIGLFVVLPLLTACAGTADYSPPSAPPPVTNSKVLEKSRDAVWDAAVPAIASEFFVINNIDKQSGFINVSYSGDPMRYIDCGEIRSSVTNARGTRNYRFPAAAASEVYEVYSPPHFVTVDRRMALEGRTNLIFQAETEGSTRVTANTRYVVTRTLQRSLSNGLTIHDTDTVSFNTGGRAEFAGGDPPVLACVANGNLERELLSIIQ